MAELENYKKMLENAQTAREIDEIRVHFLGRNGILTNLLKSLSTLDVEARKVEGKRLNDLKTTIEAAIQARFEAVDEQNNANKKSEIDFTIPFSVNLGNEHLISASISKLHKIFEKAGFSFVIGPDIEDVFYNFEALNTPKEHPARDMQDSFYMVEEGKLARTQTTSVQIRLLEKMQENSKTADEKSRQKLSQTRGYTIGRVYRNDSNDATHGCMFQQIEGIILEDGVTMQHLKGFLEFVYSEFFERKVCIRFRPSYFPFTEPSCEIDVFTKIVNGKRVLQDDYSGIPLELGGCGIIHPKILENFGFAGKQAFAFGLGLERAIMVKHGITNFHDLYNNQVPILRYISQC